jgi:dTDP-4-amino-4,6-dideoxygalactose transaminase
VQKREVPFTALGGLWEQDDIDAAMGVMQQATEVGGSFFPLPEETQFQEALAEHEGAAHAIVVNSCGTALDLCMMALEVGPGDEVIVPPLTFICTATCAAARGAKVVFADIDPLTMNLDPAAVREKISDRTRALIPVHFTGLACDVDAFDQISAETGIPVIYDAAHALGARSRGQALGGRGMASCYSFQSNKNITTLGEGGAVLTDDPDLAETVRAKKTFGHIYGNPVRVVTVGFNYRLNKVQCAVGLTQLAKAQRVIGLRQERMEFMQELLADVEELRLPHGIGAGHASHLYVVRLDSDRMRLDTEDLRQHLKTEYGVGTGKHYSLIWDWEVFQQLEYDNSDCPEGIKACAEVFSLPLFPYSTEEDLEYVAWALRAALSDLT